MKHFSLLLGLLVLTLFSIYAQNIKEINGVYYNNEKPYTGSYSTFYDNGKPHIEMNLICGFKNGEVKVFFENGELNEIRSYKKNIIDGTWLTYNENKVKVAEAHYLDGKKEGKWYIWDDNGKLIYELEYSAGEKIGIWKNYDKNGNLINERAYSKPEK